MNTNYLTSKKESIRLRMTEIDKNMLELQSALSNLQQERSYLMGSLAVVNELFDLQKGGSDEEGTDTGG